MDGFAIATDRDSSEKARLNVIGESGAGKPFEGIDSGEARIFVLSQSILQIKWKSNVMSKIVT